MHIWLKKSAHLGELIAKIWAIDIQCGDPGFVSDSDGDFNADCYVDFFDFAELGLDWQSKYEMSDLALIAQNWLDRIDPDAPCNYLP